MLEPKKQPKIEAHEEVNQKKDRYKGSKRRKHKNHIIWEYNTKTGELLPAKIDKEVVWDNGEPKEVNKLHTKKDCIYFEALNQKNAIKHLLKNGYIKSDKIVKE